MAARSLLGTVYRSEFPQNDNLFSSRLLNFFNMILNC